MGILQSLTKLVGKFFEKCFIEMPYFLHFSGNEIALFMLASLKPLLISHTSPFPTIQCWGVLIDEKQNFVFQHCSGGMGDAWTLVHEIFPNIFVKDCIIVMKSQIAIEGFSLVTPERINQIYWNLHKLWKIIYFIL